MACINASDRLACFSAMRSSVSSLYSPGAPLIFATTNSSDSPSITKEINEFVQRSAA